jgi:hypothetical protein
MVLPKFIDFEIVTICGSMRFYNTMLEVAQSLSLAGVIVLMPFCNMKEPMYEGMGAEKIMLDKMHLAKIDLSDGIYVVNGQTGDTDQYIGHSTRKEISYTRHNAKYIRYHIQPLEEQYRVDTH